MIKINVFSEEKAWSKKIRNKDLFFKKICNAFPKKYKFFNKNVTFTLLLSNNKNIKKLNKFFRKKNKSTDILSFPYQSKKNIKKISTYNYEIYLGDIIINFKKMTTSSKILFRNHLNILLVHGLVHLFGYDHKTEISYKKMHLIENRLLKKIK